MVGRWSKQQQDECFISDCPCMSDHAESFLSFRCGAVAYQALTMEIEMLYTVNRIDSNASGIAHTIVFRTYDLKVAKRVYRSYRAVNNTIIESSSYDNVQEYCIMDKTGNRIK